MPKLQGKPLLPNRSLNLILSTNIWFQQLCREELYLLLLIDHLIIMPASPWFPKDLILIMCRKEQLNPNFSIPLNLLFYQTCPLNSLKQAVHCTLYYLPLHLDPSDENLLLLHYYLHKLKLQIPPVTTCSNLHL